MIHAFPWTPEQYDRIVALKGRPPTQDPMRGAVRDNDDSPDGYSLVDDYVTEHRRGRSS